ncbi:MAG: permease [Candidatus Omnitrophota bacterium]|nr:MAG: permease [Candidatus Omnitrophota bacterium]
MLIPTIIMGILALIFSIIAYRKGQFATTIKASLDMAVGILPLLIFVFIVAGAIRTIISHELLLRWIGAESGMKGIFIGTLAGAIAPGGPYVSLPLAAGLLRSGAGIGTMVAFLTAWSLWATTRLPMEIGILGWRFTLIRFISVFFFPPVAGMIARLLVKIIKI